MISTHTLDTQATVAQIRRLKDAGCDYVRLTTRNIKEAEHLAVIQKELRKLDAGIPLIADVHFNPQIAEAAARTAAKVRINPGNYVLFNDKIKEGGRNLEREIYEKIHQQLRPLLSICSEYGTALRIGSNHGSLSPRILSLYGDTPMGMVESALEFVRVCHIENFHNLVISMKSSNTRVMIHANRLLVKKMEEEGMDYPIHLGVTEAGEGEDGRIKSAIGIGTLLQEGIGDTIRVSLTEEPEFEVPVARMIIDRAVGGRRSAVSGRRPVTVNKTGSGSAGGSLIEYIRRETIQVGTVGGKLVPVVATTEPVPKGVIRIRAGELDDNLILKLKNDKDCALIAEFDEDLDSDRPWELFRKLSDSRCNTPVIVKMNYPQMNPQQLLVNSSIDLGGLLIDGLGDGIWIEAEGQDRQFTDQLSFGILQGSRTRFTKTEFIACPSCGRTLFDIQETLRTIRGRMGHLRNLKIAVMGCIVNGPGEMADADYGYVGSGPGKVTLYKGKTIIRRNISEKEAVGELEKVIRENGDWDEA
jgi:(E)-4-hydroxy-3-methylbut-2-enyl-diphosphate synthase